MNNDITQILRKIETGDQHAASELLPLVYEELRKLAGQKMSQDKAGQTLQPTALVHEAFMRLVGQEDRAQWDNRGHFFAAAATAMRRILIEAARRRKSEKRGGNFVKVDLNDDGAVVVAKDDRALLALDVALDHLASVDAELTRLVELRYFTGLTVDEAAKAMGVSPRTVKRNWAYARAWLHRELNGSQPKDSEAEGLYDDKIVAALCLVLNPEKAFTKILQVARAGQSGETYAFNADGLMVTGSRFDNELKSIGLLSDDGQSRSILNVQIRDPGVDMTQGHRSQLHRPDQPLTRMAAACVAGENGVDVDGYRDYRGVQVVGAWKWLPRDGIGVATEVDTVEAFRSLRTLRRAFAVLVGLLLASALGLCALSFYASKLDRDARRATLEAKRLGQYALDEEIGAGGMGVVYRTHHDMLHRPTAVKLLHINKTNDDAIARFEREVQLTSQLTHPNTIAIYDYGRTPEGVFYYAMEFLDGISLEDLVTRFGPLPESRVIAILRQLCGSLTEAHGLGMIHRDIKPANIMLAKIGGMCDFVKLLDFGLAKPQDADRNITMAGSLTGTPLYLSPEAIQHQDLDARSDLYAVGAVGYFLLTGEPVFDGRSIVEICRQHVEADPQPLEQRLGEPVNEDLEALILRCLAKKPDNRPSSAELLEEELSLCRSANLWTRTDAKTWWLGHQAADVMTNESATASNELVATIIKSESGG